MSEFMRLPPSGMAVAGENDTFLTQLMNDNMRKAGQQLPCCARFKYTGLLRAGYPARLAGVNPVVAGVNGPFLGIVTIVDTRKGEVVLQMFGSAVLIVQGSAKVGDFVGTSSDNTAVVTPVGSLGSDNHIGIITDILQSSGATTTARVLLHSWCAHTGRVGLDGTVQSGPLCADHRPAGMSKLTAGRVTVNSSSASGWGLLNTPGTVLSDESVRFSFKRPVYALTVQPSDGMYSVSIHADNLGFTLRRVDGSPVRNVFLNVFGTTE